MGHLTGLIRLYEKVSLTSPILPKFSFQFKMFHLSVFVFSIMMRNKPLKDFYPNVENEIQLYIKLLFISSSLHGKCLQGYSSVANSLLSQELELCFSDSKFTKAPYTKTYTRFFLDTK